jgi:hypothetical protein
MEFNQKGPVNFDSGQTGSVSGRADQKVEISLMRNVLLFLLVGLLSLGPTGCSLLVSEVNQTLTVMATEPDARIFINGVPRGQGMVEVRVPRDQEVRILVEKDGFYPTSKSIGCGFSTTGILDLIGGCIILLPFFGLLAPGSRRLMEDNVIIPLEKIETAGDLEWQ